MKYHIFFVSMLWFMSIASISVARSTKSDDLFSAAALFSEDTPIFCHLQSPEAIADGAAAFSKLLSEAPEFKGVCIPWLFESEENYRQFFRSVEQLTTDFGRVESLTIALEGSNIVLVVRCEEELALTLVRELEEAAKLLRKDHQIEEASAKTIITFLSESWQSAPSKGGFVLSNSSEFLSQTVERLQSQAKDRLRSLSSSRSFKRGAIHFQREIADADLVFYFRPIDFADYLSPYIDPGASQEVMRSYGVDGLVSCVGLVNFRKTNGMERTDVVMCMPYTVPRKGLAAIWNAGLPIENIPAIFSIENVEYYSLKAEHVDLADEETALRNSYDTLNGEGSYDRDRNEPRFRSAFRIRYGVRRNFDDGRFSHGLVRISKLTDTQSAIEAIREYQLKNKEKFPVEEMRVGGEIGWFQSEETYRREFEFERDMSPKTDSDFYLNTGILVSSAGWVVEGPKTECEEVVRVLDMEVPVRTNFVDLFPGAECLNGKFRDSSWIEYTTNYLRLSYMNGRLVHHLQQYHKPDWKKLWKQARDKEFITFPPENDTDRQFLVSDIPLRMLNLRWSRSLATFNCDDQIASFGWSFINDSSERK